MQLTRILREGFIAGLIGAAAVALWFLIVDVIAGRPFFTPAMLGSAVFWGVHDPAQVVIEFSREHRGAEHGGCEERPSCSAPRCSGACTTPPRSCTPQNT